MRRRFYSFLQFPTYLFLSYQRLWAERRRLKTRRRERARHGLEQLRLWPRPQPPGKDFKGAKKAAYYPKTRYSPKS